MPTSNFEAVFSELSHALLTERAPGLMSYLVGFQVLDQDEEGDSPARAAGVFGFKVNKNWLYAPVFFMNGRIKGMDMLYAKNQDIFVPLQDDWVSYLLSRQPSVLGETEELNESELRATAPDFTLAVSGNSVKTASADEPKHRTFRRHVAELKDMFRALPEGVTVGTLKQASQYACDLRLAFEKAPILALGLVKLASQSKDVERAVEHFYGSLNDILPEPDALAQSIRKSAGWLPQPRRSVVGILADLEKRAPLDTGSVTAVTERNLPLFKRALSEADVTKVILGGTVYHDTRRDTSILMDVRHAAKRASDTLRIEIEGEDARVKPTDNGLYTVLTADGERRECYVATRTVSPCWGGGSGYALVLDLDSEVSALTAASELVVVEKPREEKPNASRLKKFIVGADDLEVGKKYALFFDQSVSLPFQLISKAIGEDSVTLKVAMVCATESGSNVLGSSNGLSSWLSFDQTRNGRGYVRSSTNLSELRDEAMTCHWDLTRRVNVDGKSYEFHADFDGAWTIVLRGGQTSDLTLSGSVAIVPSDVKFLDCGWPIAEKSQHLRFDRSALWDDLFDRSSTRQVKIASTSSGYLITDGGARHELAKRSAVFDLMELYRLREDDAREMLGGATAYGHPYWIKSAAGFIPSSAGAPFPDDTNPQIFSDLLGVQAQAPYEKEVPAVGINADPGNDRYYDIRNDPEVGMAIQAANKGKKDVFDVSMVKGLVKSLDVSAMIDEYLPDLIRGMDRVGRVLFMFYWHLDSFQERYGRQDVVELEDSLKNIFKGQGDLILFLRRKTAESQPELQSMDMTLSDVSA